ncbi:MAG TPA: hypothetical protein EYP57_06735 [Thermodesulfobacteriaceae bacterium]|nr:hypothetical protein [Thermodesulfobacteriaceae bacterium]
MFDLTDNSQKALFARASRVRLLALDCDGILTDGRIVYTSDGEQIQNFHVQDGLGLKLLNQAGIHLAIISSRTSTALSRRAGELGIDMVYQGRQDKVDTYKEILGRLGLENHAVAYMGDDLIDLPLLRRSGFSLTVPDAPDQVKQNSDYVTSRPGGRGAVREACELILKARNRWDELLGQFLS